MQFSYLKVFLVLTFIEVQFKVLATFLAFFFWLVNFVSLVYKLCVTFQTFQDTRTLFILEFI